MSDEMNETGRRAGDAEIARLAGEFEACAVEKFGHAEHLTIALWYLARLPEAEARERVRAGLMKLAALDGGDKDAIQEVYAATVSAIDKSVNKGVLHRNAAARYKSRLTARVNGLGAK